MKRWWALVLAISLVAALAAGCAPPDAEPPEDEVITITVSHNNPADSPEDQGLEEFKRLVEERTEGQVEVEIYPALQLGSMREQSEATQAGTIEITQQPTAVLSTFVMEYELADFPYLFPDYDTYFNVLDGEVGDRIGEAALEEGFVQLGWMASGFKQFTATTPIRTPEDMEGLQMRVMPAPLLNAQMEAWGASPTPIEFGELYNSLQQGVVDGQENPIKTIYLNQLYEVQDYMMLSDHGFLGYAVVANQEWFEGLPEDIQEAIRTSMADAAEVQRQILRDEEGDMLQAIEDDGTTEIIELTEEEKDAFREMVMSVHEEFADRVGPDLLEMTYEEVERLSQ